MKITMKLPLTVMLSREEELQLVWLHNWQARFIFLGKLLPWMRKEFECLGFACLTYQSLLIESFLKTRPVYKKLRTLKVGWSWDPESPYCVKLDNYKVKRIVNAKANEVSNKNQLNPKS